MAAVSTEGWCSSRSSQPSHPAHSSASRGIFDMSMDKYSGSYQGSHAVDKSRRTTPRCWADTRLRRHTVYLYFGVVICELRIADGDSLAFSPMRLRHAGRGLARPPGP